MGFSNILWPKFNDIESARGPIRLGAYVSCGLMILSIVLAIVKYPKINESPMLILDATWWAIIAAGIFYKKSRTAAIFGLFRFILGTIVQYITTGTVFLTYIATIVITLIFIGSVRGTFFYHKFKRSSIHRKDFIILNLLALLYSSVTTVIVFFIVNRISNEANEIFFWYVAVSLGLIIYFLTLIRKMPFTKNRVIVTYSFPENDLKRSTTGETPSEKIIESEEPSKE